MYNDRIANNNHDFVLKEVYVILNKEPFFVKNCNMNGVSNDRLYPNKSRGCYIYVDIKYKV